MAATPSSGKRPWIKYHFKTDQGVENFTDAEAKAMTAEDPDFHRRDLRQAIDGGDHPSWTLRVQIMPFEDAADYRFNPFDLTKVWPHGDYPLHDVGRLVLDRNPASFFAEIEQAAFEPANMVPGIGPSPDKMLLGRLFSYPDAHRYRIGTNYAQLPVNRPHSPVNSYNKDGAMRYEHAGDQPVYAPNSYGGPQAQPDKYSDPGWFVEAGEIMRTAYRPHAEDTDFVQVGDFYRKALDDTGRAHLIDNLAGHLGDPDVTPPVQERALGLWDQVDPDLDAWLRAAVGQADPVAADDK